jgi:hypothetical protein
MKDIERIGYQRWMAFFASLLGDDGVHGVNAKRGKVGSLKKESQ